MTNPELSWRTRFNPATINRLQQAIGGDLRLEDLSVLPPGGALYQDPSPRHLIGAETFTDAATPGSVRRLRARRPLVLRTVSGGSFASVALSDLPVGVDGMHILSQAEGKPGEVILPRESVSLLRRSRWPRVRRASTPLEHLKDFWSDVMPGAFIQEGPYKVRTNFWQNLIIALETYLEGENVSPRLKKRATKFVSRYSQHPTPIDNGTTENAMGQVNDLMETLLK